MWSLPRTACSARPNRLSVVYVRIKTKLFHAMQIRTGSRKYSAHVLTANQNSMLGRKTGRQGQGNPAAASVPHEESCHVCTDPLFLSLMLALITVC